MLPFGSWLGQARKQPMFAPLCEPERFAKTRGVPTSHDTAALLNATEVSAMDARPAFETRTEPVSRLFGFDRGQPIDRYYIETFLTARREQIRGRVLEVGDRSYTRQFGRQHVTQSDVVNLYAAPGTTIAADLADPESLPADTMDCFILTQTLPFVLDFRAALRNARRTLKVGGALLLTVPGISQISRYDADRWGDYWRFTPQAVRHLLDEAFGVGRAEVRVFGNLRTAIALLEGLATHEVPHEVLDVVDEDYPVVTAACAVKDA